MNSLRAQLELATSNGEAAQQSSRELKEKAETLQAKLLQAEIEHERARAELKKQWELDVQDRVQRTVTAVQTQLEEVKGGRQHLEKEVAKLQLEIARLGEERVELQQAHAQQLRVTKEELLEREQELHTAADRVRALQMEQQQVEELRQQQERRLQEQSRRMETTQAALEERIQVSHPFTRGTYMRVGPSADLLTILALSEPADDVGRAGASARVRSRHG